MMFTISKSITALVASVGLFTAFTMAAPAARADDKDIAQALRAGGLVLVVRHGATFPDQADTDPLNFDNITAQRNLNDKGKALAKSFGDAIRQAGFTRGTIVAADEHLGGNLRLAFPHARVLTPPYPVLDPPPRGGDGCVLAWHARMMGDAVPPQLAAFVAGRFQLTPAGAPVVVELPMLRRPARLDRFAYLIATNADGDCRPR